MTRLFFITVAVVVLFVASKFAVAHFSKNSVAKGVTGNGAARTLSDCPATPNCQFSQAAKPSQQVAPFTYSKTPNQIIKIIANEMAAQPGATVQEQDENYLWVTFKTKLMAYTDDVEFLMDGNSTLQVRSASRLGKSDLGANKKRIERLRILLKDKL